MFVDILGPKVKLFATPALYLIYTVIAATLLLRRVGPNDPGMRSGKQCRLRKLLESSLWGLQFLTPQRVTTQSRRAACLQAGVDWPRPVLNDLQVEILSIEAQITLSAASPEAVVCTINMMSALLSALMR